MFSLSEPVSTVAAVEWSWRVKLVRAREHLDRFAEECQLYLDRSSAGFEFRRDDENGTIDVVLSVKQPPPLMLGAIAGDVMQNLRSALDSIAWEAVSRASGGDVPAAMQGDVYFPITASPAHWEKVAVKMLPGVSVEGLERFREQQPWFQDEIARGLGIDVDRARALRSPLWRLHEMAKHDRHRTPNILLARAGDTWLGAPEGIVTEPFRVDPPPWKNGDTILRWRIAPAERVSEVQPDGKVLLCFAEDESRYGVQAVDALKAMTTHTIMAIRALETTVLEVVTPKEQEQLSSLGEAWRRAQDTLEDEYSSGGLIDRERIVRDEALREARDTAEQEYFALYRDLYE